MNNNNNNNNKNQIDKEKAQGTHNRLRTQTLANTKLDTIIYKQKAPLSFEMEVFDIILGIRILAG